MARSGSIPYAGSARKIPATKAARISQRPALASRKEFKLLNDNLGFVLQRVAFVVEDVLDDVNSLVARGGNSRCENMFGDGSRSPVRGGTADGLERHPAG